MIELLGAFQRAALQAGVLLLVGAAVWKLWISPRALGQPMRDASSHDWETAGKELNHGVARIASIAAVALIPIWLLRFCLQVIGFRDPFAPLSEDILFLLRYTIFGPVWIVQGVTILLVAGALVRLRRRGESDPGPPAETERSAGQGSVEWGVVILGAAVLSVTLAMSSHGLSVEGNRTLAVSADLTHTLAAGAWLGTLGLILSNRRTVAGRTDAHFAAQLRVFSPIAIGAVTLLIAMGVYLGWQYLGTLSNLWGTFYGRILAAKVLVAGTVMLMGLLNWRRGMPAIDSPDMRAAVWKRATWEVTVAVVVLLLTGALTGAPRPPSPLEEQGGSVQAEGVDVVARARARGTLS